MRVCLILEHGCDNVPYGFGFYWVGFTRKNRQSFIFFLIVKTQNFKLKITFQLISCIIAMLFCWYCGGIIICWSLGDLQIGLSSKFALTWFSVKCLTKSSGQELGRLSVFALKTRQRLGEDWLWATPPSHPLPKRSNEEKSGSLTMLLLTIKSRQMLRVYLDFLLKANSTTGYKGKYTENNNVTHIHEMTICHHLCNMDFWRGNLGTFLLKINFLMQNKMKQKPKTLFGFLIRGKCM